MSQRIVVLNSAPDTRARVRDASGTTRLQVDALAKAIGRARPGVFTLVNANGLGNLAKKAFAERVVGAIKESAALGPVGLANVSPELFGSLRGHISARNSRLAWQQVVPVITTGGEWRWLGAPSLQVENELGSVVREAVRLERSAAALGVADEVPLSAESREVIAANSSLFLAGEDAAARLCVHPLRILVALEEMEEGLLKGDVRRGAVRKGHFQLPSGLHSELRVDTHRILSDTWLLSCAKTQVKRLLWLYRPDFIVTFSILSFFVGESLRQDGLEVIHTFGYPAPKPRYGSVPRNGASVMVLTDIVSTGTAVSRLKQYLVERGCNTTVTYAVCDGGVQPDRRDLRSLVRLPIRTSKPGTCKHCRLQRPAHRIDAFSGLQIAATRRKQDLDGLLPIDELLSAASASKAIKRGHRVINGSHFEIFVDVRAVLQDRALRARIVRRALVNFGVAMDVIVAPKNEGALLLAYEAQEQHRLLGIPVPRVVPAARDHEGNHFVLPGASEGIFRRKRILAIDDGANTGRTMLGLKFAIDEVRPAEGYFFVALDRLLGDDERAVRELVGENFVVAYRFPVPGYREWDCPTCREEEMREQSHREGAKLLRVTGRHASGRSDVTMESKIDPKCEESFGGSDEG